MHRWQPTAAVLTLVVATGCAVTSTVADPVQPAPVRTSDVASPADPSRLVGSWHLEAAGEPAGAILTIGDRVDGGMLLFHPCGMLSGTWRANRQAMFVASLDGGDGSCFGKGEGGRALLTPPWLTSAVAFAASGADETLLDARGSVVATLRPGAHPTIGPNDTSDYALRPVVTEQMRQSWREPAQLPQGVRPASAMDVQRTWKPLGSRPSHAFLTFGAEGRYHGSDGCNGVGGAYVLGREGVVLATSGPMTLIGCENSPLPSWVAQAGRLGLRDGRLLFVSPTGKVLGEAVRAR